MNSSSFISVGINLFHKLSIEGDEWESSEMQLFPTIVYLFTVLSSCTFLAVHMFWFNFTLGTIWYFPLVFIRYHILGIHQNKEEAQIVPGIC